MNPVHAARALAFGTPLAILAGSFLAPPDPRSQLAYIAIGLLLFVPAAYVSVAQTGTTRTLLAFYGGILVTIIASGILVGLLHDSNDTTVRFLVLATAVLVGATLAQRFG